MEAYKNKALSPQERAKDFLSRMTLEDKLRQIRSFDGMSLDRIYEQIVNGEEPEVYSLFYDGVQDAEKLRVVQDYCIKKTGVPVIVACEGIRGVISPRATAFPQCAGIGGSFNRENVRKMAEVIGKEARILGIRQLHSPNVDIQRDPRWGRMQESYGEDPYTVGEMGSAYVEGVQSNQVGTTVKHFIAYGVPEGGINLAPAHIGEREIREVMLEPFKKCIDAGAWSVMPSYNEIDGVPVHASKKYLRDILREELGFDGMVISDYGAVEILDKFHHVSDGPLETGRLALEAGVDLEAITIYGYGEELKQAVQRGEIPESLVDEAVLRVLTFKFQIGAFDNPYAIVEDYGKLRSEEAIKLSQQMDEESVLLLENDGILPLSEKQTIAVIGNNAKDTFMGDYITHEEYCVSFYDGMVNRLGKEHVLYARGCNPISGSDEMIAEAVAAAEKADTVFLVLGDSDGVGGGVPGANIEQKKEITCSEGYDTHDLTLPKWQKKLFDAITALHKPTILVLYAGRAYAIPEDVKKVNAFLFSWGGGEQNGTAMARLIFGDISPSAKLSISFPQSVGHIPCFYNHKGSARGGWYNKPGSYEKPGMDYILSSPEPWYPFGYGLSYTKVEYSNLSAEKKDGEIRVRVDVKNSGEYEISESVLLFAAAKSCPITPFVKQLKRFEKVHLQCGEKKTVEFLLSENDFTYIDLDYKTAICRGTHQLMVDHLEREIKI